MPKAKKTSKVKNDGKPSLQGDSLVQGTLFEENYLQRTHKTLTTNPEIALTELVANAWDAGASQVDITIPDECGRAIVVKDNGTGLTVEEFEKCDRLFCQIGAEPGSVGEELFIAMALLPSGVDEGDRLEYDFPNYTILR